MLISHAEAISKVQVLRTYWYDAARDGIRTQEQRAIAALPDVKLRLGRLNAQNEQKGVDALIYRDMITLAQQRSVSDIVLVSGDEDLREGVRAAQDHGVRVVLVGIKADQGHNQSEELTYEVDRCLVLDRDALAPAFSLRVIPAPPAEAAGKSTPGQDGFVAYATEFAAKWMADALESEINDLRAARPRIPRPLDIELMTHVSMRMGIGIQDDDAARRVVRAAWWDAIGGAPSLDA